jgi:hypothetical protein
MKAAPLMIRKIANIVHRMGSTRTMLMMEVRPAAIGMLPPHLSSNHRARKTEQVRHCLSRRKRPSTGSWVPALNRTLGSYAAITESRVDARCALIGVFFCTIE